MVTLPSHRRALDMLSWFSLNWPHPGVFCQLDVGQGARTPLMRCCSGLSKSLQEFDLYDKMALPLVSALLGLGDCECVVKKPISAFPSMFWSKLPNVGTVSSG